MAIPHSFTSGTKAKASEVNTNFEHVEKDSPYYAPIGSVMAWLKTYTNTPALPIGWVECNGQVLSDASSPYNTQTIPNLNGDNRFLRGNSTSGDVTDGIHGHQWSWNNAGSGSGDTFTAGGSGSTSQGVIRGSYNSSGNQVGFTQNSSRVQFDDGGFTTRVESIPKSYTVVWIMRVK